MSVISDEKFNKLEQILAEFEDENNSESEPEPAKDEKVSPKTNHLESRPKIKEPDQSYLDTFSYDIPAGIDLDSSDDEEARNCLESKYNDYGSSINKKLKQQEKILKDQKIEGEVQKILSNSMGNQTQQSIFGNGVNGFDNKSASAFKIGSTSENSLEKSAQPINGKLTKGLNIESALVFVDPVFGLRLRKPLVSSKTLVELMENRKAVNFSNLQYYTKREDLSDDWVVAGVIVSKTTTQMSKKGTQYIIWRLSDLKGDMKTVSVFLFQMAYKKLWKTTEGTCVAILNPKVLEKTNNNNNNEIASLSIDVHNKVLILGESNDLGFCRAQKQNGDICKAIVNKYESEFCIYHVKREFDKMSRRSELQSTSMNGGLNELRNKVLGRSEVFYAGRSFTSISAKKSPKLQAKDNKRLQSLMQSTAMTNTFQTIRTSDKKQVTYAERGGPISKVASNLDTTSSQRAKDLQRLKLLSGETTSTQEPIIDKTVSKCTAAPETSKDEQNNSKLSSMSINSYVPKLSRESFSFEVNFKERRDALAKARAIELIKQKPIEKCDPNKLRGTREGKRRAIDLLNEQSSDSKRIKIEEEVKAKSRIQRIMEASSTHTDLVEQRHKEQMEEHFKKLECKEKHELKMLNTFSVPCKVVSCSICKYTAFSASQLCKDQAHPLKVSDGKKRFFQCKDCGYRVATPFKLPQVSCKVCKGSNWLRAAMIRERKGPKTDAEILSVRGDEETFIGNVSGTANLNLLVPET